MTRADSSAVYPASPSQTSLWYLHALRPTDPAYHEPLCVVVPAADHTQTVLEDALTILVRRHEALRTALRWHDGQLYQHVQSPFPVEIAWEAGPADVADLRKRLSKEAVRSFDLSSGEVFRAFGLVWRGHLLLHITFHHVAIDGWSIGLLLEELRTLLRGEQIRHEAVPYRRYSMAPTDPTVQASARHFWGQYLEEASPSKLLHDFALQSDSLEWRPAGSVTGSLPVRAAEAVRGLARSAGSTVYAAIAAALSVALWDATGDPDILFISPAHGRDGSSDLLHTVGYCVNPIATRIEVDGRQSATDLLAAIHKANVRAYANPLPIAEVVSAAGLGGFGQSPFGVMLSFHQPLAGAVDIAGSMFASFDELDLLSRPAGMLARVFGTDSATSDGGAASVLALERPAAKMPLVLEVYDAGDGPFGLVAEFDESIYRTATVEGFLERWSQVLGTMALDPFVSCNEAASPSRAEIQGMSAAGTGPKQERTSLLPELIIEQNEGSDVPVCASQDGVWSGDEIVERARAVANSLTRAGAQHGSMIAVASHSSRDLPAILLGVWLAGGAYLPLDPASPPGRVAKILSDAAPDQCIWASAGPVPEELAAWGWHLAEDLLNHAGPPIRSHIKRDAADPACVIYTSGSTGMPKGAVTTFAGLTNRVQWMQDEFSLAAEDVILQRTSLSFDVAGWELFWPLISEARSYALGSHGYDVRAVTDAIDEAQVSVLHLTPTLLHHALRQAPRRQKARLLFVSGEVLSPNDAVKARDVIADRVFNLYGPAEASIDVTWQEISGDEANLVRVPIGRPLPNTNVVVMRNGRCCGVGSVGELVIGGMPIGPGYIGSADGSSAFGYRAINGSERMWTYATGDRARVGPDGLFEFLGRRDAQVKVAGIRIELGEIEALLLDQAGVVAAGVVVGGDGLLAAVEGDDVPVVGTLRASLLRFLPPAAVPRQIYRLDVIPTTPTGKTDRRALLETLDSMGAKPERTVRPELDINDETPSIEAAKHLWRGILGDACDLTVSFFDAGGDSLALLQLQEAISENFDLNVSVADLLSSPTLESLTVLLESDGASVLAEHAVQVGAARGRDRMRRRSMRRRLG